MTGRLISLSLCSYILLSGGLSFKYYMEASPLRMPDFERLHRTAQPESTPEGAQDPESDSVLFERAEEHFFSRRYNTSLALFLRVLQENPEHSRAHSYAGDIYLNQRKLDEAEHHFRIAAEIGEEKHKSEFRLGQIAYLRKDASNARAHLERSLEHYPDFPPAVFYLGLVSWKLEGDRTQAAVHWEKYVTLKPEDPQKIAIQRAIEYLREKPESASPDSEESRPPLDVEKLLESVDPASGPTGPSGKPADSNQESSQSDVPESKALLDIARSLEDHPERLPTVLNLARIQKEQGNSNHAQALLEEARKHSDDPALSSELSDLYEESGQTAAARNLLRKEVQRKDLNGEQKALPALKLARITQPLRKALPENAGPENPGPGPEQTGPSSDRANDAPEGGDNREERNSQSDPSGNKKSEPNRSPTNSPDQFEENAGKERPASDNSGPQSQTDDSESLGKTDPGANPTRPTPEDDFNLAMQILQENKGYRYLSEENRKEFFLIQAREAFRRGDSQQAYARTLQILKEDPTDRRGLILAASIAQKSETSTSFSVYEERIRSLYGDDPEMMTALAQIYMQDDPAKGRSLLEETVKKHPESVTATLALVDMEKERNPDQALKRLETLIAENPGNLDLLRSYIDLRVKQGPASPELQRLMNRARDIESKNPGSFPELSEWNKLYPPEKTAPDSREPENVTPDRQAPQQ